MRRVCGVLAALVLLASAPMVLAAGAVWTSNSVGVYDYTSAAWRPIVEMTVGEFNAMLPARAPSLLYLVMGETPCDQISEQLHRGGIVVCNAPMLASGDELGRTVFYVSQGQLSRVRITLPEATNAGLRDNVVCHEFMHATTGIADNYGARPDTSCVWGDLSAPGSFDAQYAHQVYKQKDRKASGGKKHGGKHHGGKHHGGKHHGGGRGR
jgi:uncharacterized membrane protein YgcG